MTLRWVYVSAAWASAMANSLTDAVGEELRRLEENPDQVPKPGLVRNVLTVAEHVHGLTRITVGHGTILRFPEGVPVDIRALTDTLAAGASSYEKAVGCIRDTLDDETAAEDALLKFLPVLTSAHEYIQETQTVAWDAFLECRKAARGTDQYPVVEAAFQKAVERNRATAEMINMAPLSLEELIYRATDPA